MACQHIVLPWVQAKKDGDWKLAKRRETMVESAGTAGIVEIGVQFTRLVANSS